MVSEAVALKRAHVKKLAVHVLRRGGCVCPAVPQLAAALKKEGYGTQIVYKSGIAFAAPNYTAQCLAAKQAGAQAVTVGDASEIVTKVARTAPSRATTRLSSVPAVRFRALG